MKSTRKKFTIILIIAIIGLTNACQPSSPTQSLVLSTPKSDSTLAVNTPQPIVSTPSEENSVKKSLQDKYNPLTGEFVDDPKILNRRPVMIKVSNFPREGRPHAGLAFADIVFDYYIGTGMNRFLALFYGQDAAQIGPVRSGRLVDISLTHLYQGILGFGSADGDTRASIFSSLGRRAIINLEAPCPAFCGTDTHDVNGVFANSAEVSKWYSQNADDNQRYDLSGMVFDPNTPVNGKPGDQVTIKFNYENIGEWRYNKTSGNYLRWTEQASPDINPNLVESLERTTGKQLAFSNVIIIFAKYIEYAASKHNVELWQNTEGQRAIVFRNGQVFEGKWKTNSQTTPIQFIDNNNQPLPLAPGNSWIVIAGLNSSFIEKKQGQWEMFFILP